MRKSDIVTAVAAAANLTSREADDAVAALLEQVTNALSRGENVALMGFGAFSVRQRPARQGRHPQTGQVLQVPASRSVVFKPGKALRNQEY